MRDGLLRRIGRASWLGARRVIAVIVLLLCLLAVFHLCAPPVYEFPEPRPFRGDRWYNPLELEGGEFTWLRMNHHGHSVVWGGLTSGSQPAEEVWRFYRENGYDIPCISNYFSIEPPGTAGGIYVSAYEHGSNIAHHHHVVLGAEEVSWLNFPLFPTRWGKQMVLDALRAKGAEIIIAAHPDWRAGYSLEDMSALSGLDGLEIRTKRSLGEQHWDAALSAGRRLWGFCADDGHDLRKRNHTLRGWTLVAARDRTSEAVFEALRAGRFYGAWRLAHKDDPRALVSSTIADGVLTVELDRPAREILFVGQDGVVRQKTTKVARAEYRLREDDTYIRVEAGKPGCRIFLNPVYRYEDDPLPPHATPTVRTVPTFALRAVGVVGAVLVVVLFWRWWPRRRLSVSSS